MKIFETKSLLIALSFSFGSCLVGFNNPVQAIIFTETTDSNTSSPINTGTLDIGTNTINGILGPIESDASDGYLFSLPTDSEVNSISVQAFGSSTSTFGGVRLNTTSTSIFSGTLIEELSSGINVSSGEVFFNSANFPLDDSNNNFFIGNSSYSRGNNQPLNYTYTIEVASSAATPVPFETDATLGLLLIGGISGFGYFKRKNQEKRISKL